MKYVDELFVEIEKHRVLMAHATLIQGALAEIAELRSAARERAELDSLLSIACEHVGIDPAGMTTIGKYGFLVERLNSAIAYEIVPQKIENGRAYGEITVVKRVQIDGSVKWAVYMRSSYVLNKDMQWEFEPIPSSRDDEFLARTRFDTLGEAWGAAEVAKATC